MTRPRIISRGHLICGDKKRRASGATRDQTYDAQTARALTGPALDREDRTSSDEATRHEISIPHCRMRATRASNIEREMGAGNEGLDRVNSDRPTSRGPSQSRLLCRWVPSSSLRRLVKSTLFRWMMRVPVTPSSRSRSELGRVSSPSRRVRLVGRWRHRTLTVAG